DLERIERGEPPGRYFWTATYTARGDYADQLERWLQFFSRAQMSIQTFEDLVADPEAVYRSSLAFVGVDADAAPIPTFQAERVGSKQPTEPAILDRLRERFVDSNRRLVELTGIDYSVERRVPRKSSTAGTRAGSPIL
ncbi:MAG: sulfotransferase domain-containing protein, partial [Acidimicrobiia bacterium]|nr:sulfotransferase domain-containing protein [Acidimicrobiia bacterium]